MSVTSKKFFGENLIRLRKEYGLTRRELAEKLGINEGTLQGYETTDREPRYDLLIKIANFFRTSVDELVRPRFFVIMDSKLVSDNKIITQREDYMPIDFFNEFDVGCFAECVVNKMAEKFKKPSGILSFKAVNGKEIYNPDTSTEMKISCMSGNSLFKIDLNLKIERVDGNGEIFEN